MLKSPQHRTHRGDGSNGESKLHTIPPLSLLDAQLCLQPALPGHPALCLTGSCLLLPVWHVWFWCLPVPDGVMLSVGGAQEGRPPPGPAWFFGLEASTLSCFTVAEGRVPGQGQPGWLLLRPLCLDLVAASFFFFSHA